MGDVIVVSPRCTHGVPDCTERLPCSLNSASSNLAQLFNGICFFFKGVHTLVSSVYNKTEMLHTNRSGKQTVYHVHNLQKSEGGTSLLAGRGVLPPNFASEILVGATNFASKNINGKYPKFCPLNFRYDPKIGTFSQLLRLVVTELPKIFPLIW